MSKYKYWSTNKLLTLLRELDLSLSGSHVKDVVLQHYVEEILYKRGENQWMKRQWMSIVKSTDIHEQVNILVV